MQPLPSRSRTIHPHLGAVFLLAVFHASTIRADIVLGQIDTFEDNTTANWRTGRSGNPRVISSGGPRGEGDPFLQLTSRGAGGGPESRLVMFNTMQWSGNYLAAGVNAIEMDLKDFGDTPLSMRVALKLGTGPTPGFVTTTAFDLPPDGEWHHAVFLLDADHLTRLGSTTLTLDELLSNTGELRILSSEQPSFFGDFIAAQVGVDNILAGAVPEPTGLTLSLVALGCVSLGPALYRSKRRQSLGEPVGDVRTPDRS